MIKILPPTDIVQKTKTGYEQKAVNLFLTLVFELEDI